MQAINRQNPERVRDVSISRGKELAPLQGANRLTRSRRSSLRSDLRLLSDNPPGCKYVCFISTEKQSDSASCEPCILLPKLGHYHTGLSAVTCLRAAWQPKLRHYWSGVWVLSKLIELQKKWSSVYAATLRGPPCQAQANPGTLKRSKHTTTVLPARGFSGNQEFICIQRLLEDRQQALEQTDRGVGD